LVACVLESHALYTVFLEILVTPEMRGNLHTPLYLHNHRHRCPHGHVGRRGTTPLTEILVP
jgi:hypothetical protein